jgi:hypothetical protein
MAVNPARPTRIAGLKRYLRMRLIPAARRATGWIKATA